MPSSGRAHFLETRKAIIGSSDGAKVLNESDWGDAGDVWRDKVSPSYEHDEDPKGHAARGRDVEDMIADKYSVHTGRSLRRQPLRTHREHPYIGAHIDRLIEQDRERGLPVQTLEIKSPGRYNLDRIKGGTIPKEWLLQVQHQLLVTGHESAVLCILDWEAWDLLTYLMEPHAQTHAIMLAAYEKFWWHVEHQVHPELPAVEIDVESMVVVEQSEYELCHDEMIEEALGHILQAKAFAKRAGDIKTREGDRIKQFLTTRGLHKLRIPGLGKINWTVGKQKGSTDWEAVTRELEPVVNTVFFRQVMEANTEMKVGSRRFLTYPEKEGS